MHLPSHKRALQPHTVLLVLVLMLVLVVTLILILVLMLTISKSRRAPHPYIVPFMLLLSVELCEDGEDAQDFQ